MVEKENTEFIAKTKFTLSVDGSKYSLDSFNLVMHEFFTLQDKIFVYHIKANNQLDLPFASQAENIKSVYESKLIGSITKEHYSLVVADQDSKEINKIAQVYSLALKANTTVLFIGFQGTKTKPKDELTNNIKFLISNVKIPSFIIKDYNPRSEKLLKGYTWLICIDSPNSRSWNAFVFALNYIKPSDHIIGFHINPNSVISQAVNDEFILMCSSNAIVNAEFKIIKDTHQSVSQEILNYVNYTEKTPDFVVLGHNTSNYREDLNKDSPAVEVLKKAQTNILFYTTQ